MLNRVWLFLIAVASRWGALVTGGFLIGVVSIYQSISHPVPPWIYWVIGVGALFVACFKAWNDQFDVAEAEKARNLKPQIVGEVLHAKFSGFSVTRIEDGPQLPGGWLLVKLGLTNRNSVDTTIKDVSLVLETEGMRYQCRREDISRSLVVIYSDRFGNHQESPPSSLIGNITYQNPIRYRIRSEGWLLFYVSGIADPKQNIEADLRLTIIDELNDSHIIVVKSQPIRV
jgi:hypothetical protein